MRLSADILPSRALNLAVDSGRFQAVWTGRQLTIQQLVLATEAGRVDLSASLSPYSHSGRLQFDITLPALARTATLLEQLAPAALKLYPGPENRIRRPETIRSFKRLPGSTPRCRPKYARAVSNTAVFGPSA